MNTINEDFWSSPPWGTGEKKYRMGLKPIEIDSWLDRTPNKKLIEHKKNLFSLCKELEKIGLPWCTPNGTKVNYHIRDQFNMYKAMADSGCYQITLACEST